MSELVEHIRQVAEEGIEDKSLFIVDVKVSDGNPKKVAILVDGDNGVTIEDCSKLSRYVGTSLEEDEQLSDAYTLNVGSPGLDNPLLLTRQYQKNVGRKLKVRTADGEVTSGKLIKVEEEEIELEISKKGSTESVIITFGDIDWAKVQVSFN